LLIVILSFPVQTRLFCEVAKVNKNIDTKLFHVVYFGFVDKIPHNPAGFTAPPPAKCSFAMNEPLKEKIFPAVHSFQTAS